MNLERAVSLMKEVNQDIPVIERNQRKLIELFALTDYQRMKNLLNKNIILIQETLQKNKDSLRIYNEEYPPYANQLNEEEKAEADSEAQKHQRLAEKISTELNHALDIDLDFKGNIEEYSKDAKENQGKYTAN